MMKIVMGSHYFLITAYAFATYRLRYELMPFPYACPYSCAYHLSALQWCHNGRLNMASQITSLTIVYSTVYSGADQRKYQICVTGLWAGKSPVTGEFPSQRASNAENVSIWWRHHASVRTSGYHSVYRSIGTSTHYHWSRFRDVVLPDRSGNLKEK